jgi:hypothetical protein
MPAFRPINHAKVNVGKPHQPAARLGLGNPNRFANPRLADEHRLPDGKVSTISPSCRVLVLGTVIIMGCARLGCPTLILMGCGSHRMDGFGWGGDIWVRGGTQVPAGCPCVSQDICIQPRSLIGLGFQMQIPDA